jgi:hypothetical protein
MLVRTSSATSRSRHGMMMRPNGRGHFLLMAMHARMVRLWCIGMVRRPTSVAGRGRLARSLGSRLHHAIDSFQGLLSIGQGSSGTQLDTNGGARSASWSRTISGRPKFSRLGRRRLHGRAHESGNWCFPSFAHGNSSLGRSRAFSAARRMAFRVRTKHKKELEKQTGEIEFRLAFP